MDGRKLYYIFFKALHTLCFQPQLTVAMLPYYLAQQKPFVILFTPSTSDEAHAAVADVVTSHQFSQLTFSWMVA